MSRLKNQVFEKMNSQRRITHFSKEESIRIQKATFERMENYSREYSKKEKASHIAASKVLLTS
jgi:hypothetical protein